MALEYRPENTHTSTRKIRLGNAVVSRDLQANAVTVLVNFHNAVLVNSPPFCGKQKKDTSVWRYNV